MSGIIAVYGLVVAVLIANAMNPPPGQNTSLYTYVEIYALRMGV
jgi:V-type H+-transporting ATPase proteolipid subunit